MKKVMLFFAVAAIAVGVNAQTAKPADKKADSKMATAKPAAKAEAKPAAKAEAKPAAKAAAKPADKK
jgi:hypothetical protein